jgi:hypothetical protein
MKATTFGRTIRERFKPPKTREKLISEYQHSGQKPWVPGYTEYKEEAITRNLADRGLIECYRNNGRLPGSYGYRLDERVVEFPWVFSRLSPEEGYLLDAGSALNFAYLLDHGSLRQKRIVIYTLAPEEIVRKATISYVYGDLRDTLFKDGCFDEIVCISTLEHVGMDNTLLYSQNPHFNENRPNDYLKVVEEFRRLLKPGGRAFITVPFGRHENHGWLQVFDEGMVNSIVKRFDGSTSRAAYYQYHADGWQVSSSEDCAGCTYFDIHHCTGYDYDYAAAARAVACLEMTK